MARLIKYKNINTNIKICPRCNVPRSINSYSKSKSTYDGLQPACKECKKKDREKRKEYQKIYIKNYQNKNRLKLKNYLKNWFNQNKTYINNYYKIKYNTNHEYKLKVNIYNTISRNLKNKNNKTIDILGCSIKQLKHHLESQFKPEMNWNNYGKVWEIDHIVGICNFNLSKSEEQQKCFHYTNLQPLFKTTEIAEQLGYNDEIGNRNKTKKYGQ